MILKLFLRALTGAAITTLFVVTVILNINIHPDNWFLVLFTSAALGCAFGIVFWPNPMDVHELLDVSKLDAIYSGEANEESKDVF